jgi:hypothetical protein
MDVSLPLMPPVSLHPFQASFWAAPCEETGSLGMIMAYLLDLLAILSRSLARHLDILASVPLFLGSTGED